MIILVVEKWFSNTNNWRYCMLQKNNGQYKMLLIKMKYFWLSLFNYLPHQMKADSADTSVMQLLVQKPMNWEHNILILAD
jgi:hypothetical protein